MGAAKRRRRQHAMGFRHLARICGGSVVGGRPIYRHRSLGNIAEAIQRERAAAAAAQRRAVKRKR